MTEPVRIPRYVTLDKKRGETPLMALEAWRRGNSSLAHLPATYAGRLDPMAEGTLLVLLGEECKKQENYRGLDKEYEVEVALDISTDTGDVLGMPVFSDNDTKPQKTGILAALKDQEGTKEVAYPAFSSKTVNGKPLFQYALEGTLSSIDIPLHDETIYRIALTDMQLATKDALKARIDASLSIVPRALETSKAVGADFRQDAIRNAWNTLFAQMPDRRFTILSLTVTCGSGAYMRTLAERIAESLGTRGVALSIRRIKIGKYLRIGRIGLWRRLL